MNWDDIQFQPAADQIEVEEVEEEDTVFDSIGDQLGVSADTVKLVSGVLGGGLVAAALASWLK